MPSHAPPFDPLRNLRDDLHRQDAQAAKQVDQRSHRKALSDRLAKEFKQLISQVCGLLAPESYTRTASSYTDLASALLTFNQTLRLIDQEYPRYRILERLRRATSSGL